MLRAIKSAGKNDIEDIEKIIRGVLSDVDGKANEEDIQRFLNSVVTVIEKTNPDKSQHYLVARNPEKKVIAYLGYRNCIKDILHFTYTARPIEINALYLDKDARGQGLGNQMVQYLRTMAEEKRYTEIILRIGTWFKESSWGFYEHIGFEHLGMTSGARGTEYAVFRLRL